MIPPEGLRPFTIDITDDDILAALCWPGPAPGAWLAPQEPPAPPKRSRHGMRLRRRSRLLPAFVTRRRR